MTETVTLEERAEQWMFRVEPRTAPTPDDVREEALVAPEFGRVFTDHMVLVDWSEAEGWHDPRVVPFAPLALHPATAALHYGQEIFEGLKVYRHPDDTLHVFRPELNAHRLQRSALRLALPSVPTKLFLTAIDELVRIDGEWVPRREGQSLYLRPFVIASEPVLGVHPSHNALFGVIATPAGPYFNDSAQGVSLWLSTEHSRAGEGGTGAAKCGGNYAASLLAQRDAQSHGCEQVLFTDASTRTWVEEAGSMNIFFGLADRTLITPPATGTILEGVTRQSVIELAPQNGYKVEVRPFSIDEWKARAASGELSEVFASGTAAVITPVHTLVASDFTIPTPIRGFGPAARKLHAQLTGIQFGTIPDTFRWMRAAGSTE